MPRIMSQEMHADRVPVKDVTPLIVAVRRKLRLTQTDLAKELGDYSVTSIQRWEQGQAMTAPAEVVQRLKAMLQRKPNP